ncbi:MAG: hypothetical protein ABI939_08845 [Anaerolineaceae bacterium]
MAETARAVEMRRVMAEFEKSGVSRRVFCEKGGIAISTFDYWRRELAKRPPERAQLVAVKVAEAEPRFALVLANGRRIECSGEDDLARLIRMAEQS